MNPDFFGEIPSHPVGSAFSDRAALSAAGLHRPTQAGTWGKAERDEA
jgi:hypothetical protein